MLASEIELDATLQHRQNKENVLANVPFTSDRKRQTTVYKVSEEKVRVYCKGAPEIVLKSCGY